MEVSKTCGVHRVGHVVGRRRVVRRTQHEAAAAAPEAGATAFAPVGGGDHVHRVGSLQPVDAGEVLGVQDLDHGREQVHALSFTVASLSSALSSLACSLASFLVAFAMALSLALPLVHRLGGVQLGLRRGEQVR